MEDFQPTHEITFANGTTKHVMLDEGRAYSRQEWEENDCADIERNDYGEWLLLGERGRIVKAVLLAASSLGKKGGQAKSTKKAAAARENGRKGGRPRKQDASPKEPCPLQVGEIVLSAFSGIPVPVDAVHWNPGDTFSLSGWEASAGGVNQRAEYWRRP